MQQVELDVSVRQGVGKGVAHQLRAAGQVPAVLYGRGSDNMNLSVSRREMYHLLHGGLTSNVLIKLKLAEGVDDVPVSIIRDVQYDPMTEKILHVDFQRISLDEKMNAEIPIHFVGVCIGQKHGGVVDHILRDLLVECLPLDVPDSIEIDISALDVGMGLHVADLEVPENVTILTPEEQAVVSVAIPTQVIEEEEEEAEEGLEGEEGVEGEGEEGEEGEEESEK